MKSIVCVLAILAAGCGDDCVQQPCPLPFALAISITSSVTGSAVTNASIDVSGAQTTTVPCNGTCIVAGGSGSYHLKVTAPGFSAFEQTVAVSGASPACGCQTAVEAQVAVKLTPTG